jgi:hypothetical protein
VALLVGGGTSAARADATFEASIEPSEVVFLETSEISYRLRMTTGAREERFRVRVEQPRWDPVFERGPGGFPAAPDCSRDPLVLDGPGLLSDTVCRPRPPRRDVCERGAGRWELSGEVTLPPQRFQPHKPAVRGPFGSHITISTRPRTPYFRFPAGRRFRPGQVIDIRGRTEPSLRGRRVALRYRYIPSRGATPLRTLARPVIGPRGHFSHQGWRPRGRHRTIDQSCSRGFAIRERGGR